MRGQPDCLMPPNLRSITRECVHVVTHDHLWSRDKDGGHSTRSAVVKTPCCTPSSCLYFT